MPLISAKHGAASYDEAALIPLSALQHYLFCPRQCALIHTEMVWEENLFTAEGNLLHARVDRPESENRDGLRRVYALPIRSLTLGMVGRADLVCFMADPQYPKGRPFPVEYKRGKPKKEPWDRVQLCAQALCLEESFLCAVPEGALYYGATRKRYPVIFDTPLRELTLQTIRDVHHILENQRLPAANPGKKCQNCSLNFQCQPNAKTSLGNYFYHEPSP
ncbi:CRISPR-associated exonuclease, Cas4 family [Magnetococcus marinus MC-1]|uniref:CRISPR-associated exonuclease Cas4 n=1 Tax=Magnetococcus marinus (strain ATCC BAA-1437 / JCM 17883 / MC-1) TaxID=156889 RepID=A0LDG5_MAGMM|nr:CRISPR-associated protein Cas4 [Magnetococcus marinus]ABK46008.1 CRISPR-associated exonuclease, Cas4 family [Magnetococcus marinus MC-1]